MPRIGGYATRNRIVEAASRLFQSRGYHSVGLDEVIKACGTSKGVFYFHFKSKDDLAAAVLDTNIVTVPSVMKVCFSGRNWADGVEIWIQSLSGSNTEPEAVSAPVFGLALQLSTLGQAFAHRAMWTVKSFERSIYAELEARGWKREAASRRSATFSALAIGHLVRRDYTGSPDVLRDLARDLLPLAVPGRAVTGASGGAGPARARKDKKTLDFIDKRSIIFSPGRTNADNPSGLQRQILLEKLAAVFWKQGFHGTSLNDIASVCAVPKGSLHKLFGDKQAMALAAMDWYRGECQARLDDVFAAVSWPAAVDRLTAAVKRVAPGQYAIGCPLANMGLEFAVADPLRRPAAAMLQAVTGRFEKALVAYGVAAGQRAAALAATATAVFEGHLTRMCLYDDPGNIDEAREDLLALVMGLQE